MTVQKLVNFNYIIWQIAHTVLSTSFIYYLHTYILNEIILKKHFSTTDGLGKAQHGLGKANTQTCKTYLS